MRFLLSMLGLLGVSFGVLIISAGNPDARQTGELFVQVGALLLVAGLATIDIVAAISRNQK